MNSKIERLKIKLFADSADLSDFLALHDNPLIQGFTTNPGLMRQQGISDYKAFAEEVLGLIPRNKPISFSVLSNDFTEMKKQALKIASWGENVYVKIPITNMRGETCFELVKQLSNQGIKLNITAVMTLEQVQHINTALSTEVPSFISIFAGRIADTGEDPLPLIAETLQIINHNQAIKLIWASPRETFNIFQAETIGCHIITLTKTILKKLHVLDYNLTDYSLQTVQTFYQDTLEAGFTL